MTAVAATMIHELEPGEEDLVGLAELPGKMEEEDGGKGQDAGGGRPD